MSKARISIALFALISAGVAQQRLGRNTMPDYQQLPTVESMLPVSSGLAAPSADMKIGPGDLVAISIFDVPELATVARVSNMGDITFPLLGTVTLAGKNTKEAEDLIRDGLRKGGYITNPEVSIFIREYATQAVSVLGEVRRPGAYALIGTHTLMDVLTAAGGTTPTADTIVTITHAGSSEPLIVQREIKPGQSWRNNPVVRPGDRIEVARAPVVYVLGEVVRAGGFVMTDGERLTLLKALALAEGATRTASLSRVRLLRRTDTGDVQETTLSLKPLLSGKSPDLELQGGDILYIPGSGPKSFAAHAVPGLVGAAASAAIYSAARY